MFHFKIVITIAYRVIITQRIVLDNHSLRTRYRAAAVITAFHRTLRKPQPAVADEGSAGRGLAMPCGAPVR
ncbi:hypothetical protein QEG60_000038 [Pluralibacter gergoviae]|uniref:hypothetical protein n=1 Tax=Pluralibacter gergoviae TaxID=61647 RepID=UPI000A39503D|nr:hypothetical protein [Pluralibacter gergoviae]EKT9643577.1 hypothetical protein [Pluralibacter gergoviae]EKV3541449.1 hypothetical protein [Pluralibacter gergoviae]EKV9899657.1 hypothetical protein [Pluralibacter gergoviae]EKV9930975.1 hypothetical protein [Pluralibacter gergoviae]ELC3076031.1 hypothetical protein [Pluralibacter gergoviae]